VIFITCPNIKEANHIASVLIDKKLAACVNIIPKIDSIFRWQGKIDKASEVLLIVKSRKSLFKKIAATVKKHHSYDTPEIIALPIILGNKKYLHWLKDSTRAP
jgi:periplasmic divalent cation tolerance protein